MLDKEDGLQRKNGENGAGRNSLQRQLRLASTGSRNSYCELSGYFWILVCGYSFLVSIVLLFVQYSLWITTYIEIVKTG